MSDLDHTLLVIGVIAYVIVIGFYLWVRFYQPKPPCPYAEWMRAVKTLNPDWEPPHIVGPDGKYVPNPKYTVGQVIKHE